jgi:hypothetical protein
MGSPTDSEHERRATARDETPVGEKPERGETRRRFDKWYTRLGGWLLPGVLVLVGIVWGIATILADRDEADRLKASLTELGWGVSDVRIETPTGQYDLFKKTEVEVFLTGGRDQASALCIHLRSAGWGQHDTTVYYGGVKRWDRSQGVEC